MDLDDAQRRLDALFTRREEPGFVAQLWGLKHEPALLKAEALAELFKVLRLDGAANASHHPQLRAARAELSENVEIVEGFAARQKRPPFAHVTWLWRVAETLRGVAREIEGGAREAARALPKPKARLPAAAHPLPPLPSGERLQGFAVQPLIDLAARETRVLGRRRRLLEAARRALLESAAGLQLPAEQVEPHMLAIAEGIQQVTAWQQAGIDVDEDVAHQLRKAVHRRDAPTVEALLSVMANLNRSAPARSALFERIDVAQRTFAQRLGRAALPSLQTATLRTFGASAAAAVLRSSQRVQREYGATSATAIELTQAANCVDASFELGRSVSPVRALEEQRRMAIVPFPTQTMVLEPARRVADLPHSLIGDPRLIVHQLATHSLLARRYLAERKRRVNVAARYAEARYYVLDGSASMGGRRGRMRDAILISELSMLIRHLESGTATARPIVYYRYFTKQAESAIKVETVDEALAAIEAVMLRKSQGETDIQAALFDSFQQIGKERARDPNLQRAQLVLVTDGIAKIDLPRVWRARRSLEGMPVHVSVIALGGESPELKELAASQRARGEPVFYHYLSDRAMYELMGRTRIAREPLPFVSPGDGPSSGQAPLPKPLAETEAEAETSEAAPGAAEVHIPILVDLKLWQQVEHLVDELAVLKAPPDVDQLQQAGLLERAFDELGISLAESGFEAERARAEALKRDDRAIALRFDRWFPEPETLPLGDSVVPPAELVETIEVVLCTVHELIEYLSGSALSGRLDAIELLERLLLEAGVSPWAYSRALPHATPKSRQALQALRRRAG
jgi:hypothetical protein